MIAGVIAGGRPYAASADAPTYWRINITQLSGSSYATLSEIGMRSVSGGPSLCVGGTPSVISSTTGSAPALFDGSIASYWVSGWSSSWWVQYLFPSPVAIIEVALTSASAASQSDVKAFSVQSSYDGATWTTVWSVSGLTTWSLNETRVFTKP